MPPQITKFVTDTATLVVYDLECLEHRLGDDADWWSLPKEELREVNDGSAVFVNLKGDGMYEVDFDEKDESAYSLHCHLRCPSGRVFVGAAEEATSDGMLPECLRGGCFLELKPGNYRVSIGRTGSNGILLRLAPSAKGSNDFLQLLRL